MIRGCQSTLVVSYFCGQSVFAVATIDISKTYKSLVGVEVQSSYVIERCSNLSVFKMSRQP